MYRIFKTEISVNNMFKLLYNISAIVLALNLAQIYRSPPNIFSVLGILLNFYNRNLKIFIEF